ncbi:GDYXXLXY domain-containing protein [Olleya sp. Bg11-27]|uniref:GDYXXLXY domain-containing protein n=1 Tax=Olleya sp. Bg11-27 TaxID=2058135 RepID=UPI000C30393A|nr:GDYXXLXY domain-containing protein [Olleya sp. Bg11-27]AUC77052.1 hypothetical protein CW732_15760 [Olleya sp. Bg11-27]
MKKYKWIIILVNLIILLGFLNYSILKKETILSDGQLVLLELAPVDPRSLMQGDYMTLRYAISQNTSNDSISKRGYCVVKLDANGIAKKVRLQDGKTPIHTNEFLIRYNSKSTRGITIGAESYFFQEGDASKFEKAKYGGVMVDNKGNNLLVGLYNEQKQQIE